MLVALKSRAPDYPDLTVGQSYVVIGIEADDYRLLNDRGRPFLYPPALFEILDAREPSDWTTEYGDDGERYSYPRLLDSPGFFEDFFNADESAVATFWRTVNQRLALAAVA